MLTVLMCFPFLCFFWTFFAVETGASLPPYTTICILVQRDLLWLWYRRKKKKGRYTAKRTLYSITPRAYKKYNNNGLSARYFRQIFYTKQLNCRESPSNKINFGKSNVVRLLKCGVYSGKLYITRTATSPHFFDGWKQRSFIHFFFFGFFLR